jgi:hypothetical protein
MSDASDFLTKWVRKNISPTLHTFTTIRSPPVAYREQHLALSRRTSNATIYEDRDAAEHLVDNCIWETYTRGITEAALIEAAGSDLNEYMLAKLNRVVGREVENHLRGH